MVRFRRVAQLWNWLPAFRGVAEHDSLQRAAAALGVSPSALSRTVKLLEDALGASLFDRHPTGLKPTPLGAELLAITRDAMRRVDDCIAAHEEKRGRAGVVFVGATSDLAMLVVAASLPLDPAAARTFELRRTSEEAIVEELLQGNLDVVVTAGAPPHAPGIEAAPLGEARVGFYAAASHPLASRALASRAVASRAVGAEGAVTEAELARERFAASRDLALPFEGANVAIVTDSLDAARVACERSSLVAALPDLAIGSGSSLVRLRAAPSAPLVAVQRALLAGQSPAGAAPTAVIDALVAALR